MNSPSKNFISECLQGRALATDIDDYIDSWHEGETTDALPAFLGMSEQEYAVWVERPSALKLIIFARKSNLAFDQLFRFNEGHSLAARATSPEEVATLLAWLRTTGRLPS